MPVRFRPWDPRRRFVCPLPASRQGAPFRRVWISMHAAPPDWGALFARGLDLMLVETSSDGAALVIEGAVGRVAWSAGQRCTRIALELSGFSPRKRALVAAAIAKAARYG